MELDSLDGKRCVTPKAMLVYARQSDIRRLPLDDAAAADAESDDDDEMVISNGVKRASAVDCHVAEMRIYWTDTSTKVLVARRGLCLLLTVADSFIGLRKVGFRDYPEITGLKGNYYRPVAASGYSRQLQVDFVKTVFHLFKWPVRDSLVSVLIPMEPT
jgi:hypothetical protein